MGFDEYQKRARTTAIYPSDNSIAYLALGIAGESGEVAEKVKKSIRDFGGELSKEYKQAIAYELSDVLWYIANMAYELGYSLETIAEMNLEKLFSRKERGKLGGNGDTR